MPKFFMQKKLGVLKPCDDQAERYLKNLKFDEIVSVEIKKPRNARYHRWFMKLIAIVAENSEQWHGNSEGLRTALKIATGHVDTIIHPKTGETVLIPKSMSFAHMDELAFDKFASDCVQIICEKWLRVSPQQLRDAVDEYMREAA